jgi:class 3 adenylate cyclase/pimeloyl-ACP methyl ester carboxylesterase
VVDVPTTRYTRTNDGLALAYETFGEGERDLVLALNFHNIDHLWEAPSVVHMLQRLAKFGRVILLDYRGWGASDPIPLGALPTPEVWTEDTRTVMDAVGSSSAHIIAQGGSGFVGMLFAAMYPERTDTLTLFEATPKYKQSDDWPIGIPADALEMYRHIDSELWGTEGYAARGAPSRAHDEQFRRWIARFTRSATSPSVHSAYFDWVVNLDLRAVLPTIRVPTLVMHRANGVQAPLDHAHYLAEHIREARLVIVPGTDIWPFSQGADEILDEIERFITGVAPAEMPDRALAAVLFTDIVGSTEQAARLGDRQWAQILDEHDAISDRELERFRGRKVNPTGDGLLATFDGPARAVRCAQAIRDSVRGLGIEIRAGLHMGEVELRGADIGGIAVHIGQRVSSMAGPGEILVSRTVTELVAGSGIEFENRGEHALKGVPGTWTLFAVQG